MKVLGVDIGFANTGVAAFTLDENGNLTGEPPVVETIKTEKSKHKQVRRSSDDLKRVTATHRRLQELIDEHRPAIIFAEIPSGSQSSRAAFGFGTCLGVLAAIQNSGQVLIQVTPREAKKVVHDYGLRHPGKADMIEWATELYAGADWIKGRGMKYSPRNEHMADACAIVHAGLQKEEFTDLVLLSRRIQR